MISFNIFYSIFSGEMLGGHVRAVFTLITFIFIICVTCTVTSFREIPLPKLKATCLNKVLAMKKLDTDSATTYSTTDEQVVPKTESTSCLQTQTPTYGTSTDKSEQVYKYNTIISCMQSHNSTMFSRHHMEWLQVSRNTYRMLMM